MPYFYTPSPAFCGGDTAIGLPFLLNFILGKVLVLGLASGSFPKGIFRGGCLGARSAIKRDK